LRLLDARACNHSANCDHPNGALSIAHLPVLATPSAFEGVAAEPTAIVDEPQIEADKGDWEEEENRGRRRELVWLLDLPGQVTPSKWHPQLVPREPDVENEAELWFVQSYGVGLFEVGVRADEVRGSGANWIHRLGDWP
jgi:hypothetical protein